MPAMALCAHTSTSHTAFKSQQHRCGTASTRPAAPTRTLARMARAAAALDGATIKRQRAELVARADLGGEPLGIALADQADGWFAILGADLPDGWALVATGGYARGVVCPGSDLDVVLLHPNGTSDARVRKAAERIWYPLWDSGVKLSPATHSVKSLLALAGSDLHTATTILEVRSLAGDPALGDELRRRGLAQWRRKPARGLRQLLDASRERWARWGDVSSLLEPNLKDGRGGLRDRDALRWAVAAGDEFADALESPLAELDGPCHVLFAARCELHRATGRPGDVLVLQEQDPVAAALGYGDADELMRAVAEAARAIDWAHDRFWRRIDRIVERPLWPGHRSPSLAEPLAGLAVIGDELHLTGTGDSGDPAFLFEVAAAAARSDIPLSREALGALADEAPRVPPVPWSERTRRAFIDLLGAGDATVPTVEALERHDLFSRFLPEWRHVRSLPQRNVYHRYNVDRHLLRTVANAAALMRRVARPDLLLLAALLHDIGKGHTRDHSEVGVELARRIMPRLGFGTADTDTVVLLVRHHLLLAETATRRDLDDPRTAANVAAALGTAERLELLRALTEADSIATGPSAWSTWKRVLVDRLTSRVGARLDGERPVPTVDVEERFASLLAAARRRRSVVMEHDTGGEFLRLRFAARDRSGLFASVAGTLVLHRVDVTSADAWTTSDGIAVEEFLVLPGPGGEPAYDRLEADVAEVLAGRLDLAGRLAARVRNSRQRYQPALSASAARTDVRVSNDASDSATLVDVRLPDGPAVLYQVAATLSAVGLDIRSAKIATLGHEVVDVFYVSRIPTDHHPHLRATLLARLGAPDGVAGERSN